MTLRLCNTCRETFRGMQDDSCDACGSYDTTALLGRTGDEIHLSGLHIKPAPFYYEPEDTEDGFYEGDFDDDL